MTHDTNFSIDQYGIEIEFGSALYDLQLSNSISVPFSLLCDNPDKEWNIGYDDTVQTESLIGYELRTPIWSEFPHKTLSDTLTRIKKVGQVTPTAGLHFHFSGPSYAGLIFDKDIKTKALRLYQLANPHKTRQHFCTLNPCVGSRSVLRQINESHWECRCFNATLDIKTIFQNFEIMRRVLCD